MGTIVDKFNYSFEAKDLIKDSINNLGGSITSETELKEYAQELDNIYDNLPKTTGEGTNLSLTTLKGKMNIIPKGDTQQEGTPTPSTPIDIEVVTGTQEVKVENVNLFDKDNVINAYLNNSGEPVLNSTFRVSDYISIENTNNITISGNSGSSEYNCFYDSNKNFVSGFGTGTSTTLTYTIPTNAKYIRVTCKATSLNEYQLEKGSVATPYTPHQEQTQTISLGDIELCKIGNYQDYLYKSNGKWYKKEQIGKVVFTGASSENWGYWNGIIYKDYTNIKNLGGNNTNFFLNYLQHINSIA